MSAVGSALNLAAAKPLGAGVIAFMGLVAALVGAVFDPVAGAVVVAVLFAAATAIFIFALRQRSQFDGPYAVLEDEVLWDFVTDDGSTVIVNKRQRVRFNYATLVVVDHAWGEGDVFQNYDADFGTVVHRGRQGTREYVIVAMPEYRQRDSELELTSDRTISDGFMNSEEYIEHQIVHLARKSTLELRFPANRDPKTLTVTTRKGTEDKLGALRRETGRQVLRIEENRPRREETWRVTWTW